MHLKLDLDTKKLMEAHVHGYAHKSMLVLHETVSPDAPGLGDITSVDEYLARLDYGIHGNTDEEGHTAWALGLGQAIFWHAGGVNEESCGIEQVSNIPALLADQVISNEQARELWLKRDKQLRATAKLAACWHAVDPKHRPLVYAPGKLASGVKAHWNVSQFYPDSEGHTDCHPVNEGGYYPISRVIQHARFYAKLGLTF